MRVKGSCGKKTSAAAVILTVLLLTCLVASMAGCGGSSTTTASGTTAGSSGSTAGSTSATSGTTAGTDKQVTLSMVSFVAKSDMLAQTLPDWIEAVETATNGTVKIDYKGGPEVIPALEQIEAVRSGVVDIMASVSAYYQELNPGVTPMYLSPYTPTEERENGVFDYFKREHEAIETVYVGRWMTELPYYIFINKEISTPAELKGMSIRTRAAYDRFLKALGVSAVSVDTAEVYTALERGVVQGFCYTIVGVTDYNWYAKAPFCIDHPFWPANNATILFNPETWSKLSANQQDAIMKATAAYEKDKMGPYFVDAQAKLRTELQSKGVKFITFSPADAEAFLALGDKVEWENFKAKAPDKYAELRKLYGLTAD